MVSASDFFIRLLCFCERLLAKNSDEGSELTFKLLQTRQSGADCLRTMIARAR